MVDVDADYFAYGRISAGGRQTFSSVEADIERGLFDETDYDRIDPDDNSLEELDDNEFDNTADAHDDE